MHTFIGCGEERTGGLGAPSSPLWAGTGLIIGKVGPEFYRTEEEAEPEFLYLRQVDSYTRPRKLQMSSSLATFTLAHMLPSPAQTEEPPSFLSALSHSH